MKRLAHSGHVSVRSRELRSNGGGGTGWPVAQARRRLTTPGKVSRGRDPATLAAEVRRMRIVDQGLIHGVLQIGHGCASAVRPRMRMPSTSIGSGNENEPRGRRSRHVTRRAPSQRRSWQFMQGLDSARPLETIAAKMRIEPPAQRPARADRVPLMASSSRSPSR